MYTYIEAVLRERGLNKIWQIVDIKNLTMSTIFNRFVSGHIKVVHPQLDDPQYIDLEELKASNLPIKNITFTEWLKSLGNRAIPAYDTEPKYIKKTISYADAWMVGYIPEKMHPTYGLNYTLFDDQNTDIYLTRNDVESSLIQDYGMVSINGYLHLCLPYKKGLQVVNGMKTINKMNRNNIGIISFEKVGKIDYSKVNDNQLMAVRSDASLYEGVFIHLHKDIRNKSIFFVSGGYINAGGSILTVINPEIGLIKLNISKLNLERRIIESINDLDLDLGMTKNDNMPNMLNLSELRSDDVIRKYITSNHSFIVIVDSPVLYHEYMPISNVPLFGFYESKEFPKYPIVTHLGRLIEFVAFKKDEHWSIRSNEHFQKKYNFETRAISGLNNFNDIITVNGYEKEIGQQLIIGSMHREK